MICAMLEYNFSDACFKTYERHILHSLRDLIPIILLNSVSITHENKYFLYNMPQYLSLSVPYLSQNTNFSPYKFDT
jgi:hypothetical protein